MAGRDFVEGVESCRHDRRRAPVKVTTLLAAIFSIRDFLVDDGTTSPPAPTAAPGSTLPPTTPPPVTILPEAWSRYGDSDPELARIGDEVFVLPIEDDPDRIGTLGPAVISFIGGVVLLVLEQRGRQSHDISERLARIEGALGLRPTDEDSNT